MRGSLEGFDLCRKLPPDFDGCLGSIKLDSSEVGNVVGGRQFSTCRSMSHQHMIQQLSGLVPYLCLLYYEVWRIVLRLSLDDAHLNLLI